MEKMQVGRIREAVHNYTESGSGSREAVDVYTKSGSGINLREMVHRYTRQSGCLGPYIF